MNYTKKSNTIDGIAVECALPEKEQHPAPLLFVHGSSGGSWVWENFLHYFASRGWTCYALSLRGHHTSDPVDDWGKVGVDDYLKDIDTVARWIGKDLIYLGHSMGGLLGQKFAEARNPLKLILLHTGPPRSVVKNIDVNAFLKKGRRKGG